MKSFAVFLALIVNVYAQDFRATLSGQVSDPTGSAIPNAMVKAVNAQTGEVKDTKSNGKGFYTLPYLDPGTYNVEVTAAGFKMLRRESIIMRVEDKIDLPLRLSVGDVTQQMTIVGQQNSWFNNNKSCYSTLAPNVLNPYQNRFSTIFNPAAPQLNAAIEKAIPVSERYRFTLRGEAFNLSNTPIRPGPDTTFSDAQFGQLPKRQQNFPRVLQVAAKFYF